MIFLLLPLFIPLDLDLRADSHGADGGQDRILLFLTFGLLRFRLRPGPLGDSATSKQRAQSPKGSDGREKPKRKFGSLQTHDLGSLILLPGLLHLIVDLLRALIPCLDLRIMYLQARFGLGDPADTGVIYGIILSFLGVLGADPRNMEIRPNFQQEMMEGRLRVRLRLWPWRVLTAISLVLIRPGPRKTIMDLMSLVRVG